METKRWSNLVEKYGSEEAARKEMARRGAKSSRNSKGTGGFASLSAEDRSALARKAAQRRWHGESSATSDTSTGDSGISESV